jgi:hypothetical protein
MSQQRHYGALGGSTRKPVPRQASHPDRLFIASRRGSMKTSPRVGAFVIEAIVD